MIILGIETSCDETAAAIVKDGTKLLASSLSSSMQIHAKYGGVIPELAARSQIESIIPVINDTIQSFSHKTRIDDPWKSIDAIAVTSGPGLSGSLLIGVLTARTLAIIKNKPLFSINHVEAHVYANFIAKKQPKFPLLALIVSGGHTQLEYFRDHFDYELLGQTTDDAIGEAFDKVAKILGLPYPGGPNIAKAALSGDENAFKLPVAKVQNKYNFSFSGLKTAVLRAAQYEVGADYRLASIELPNKLTKAQKTNLAASFQKVAVKTVVDKTIAAYKEYKPKSVVIAGGVAANNELRAQLKSKLPISINYPPSSFCTDNAAMVASVGYYKLKKRLDKTDPYALQISPNLKMG